MRISRVENSAAFGQLQIRSKGPYFLSESKIKTCEKKLSKTKFIDVILDSHGVAIKEKMTEILHRIQSFSLFPLENSVGIKMIGEKEPLFKFRYSTNEEAENVWETLSSYSRKNSLDEYTEVALWLEKQMETKQ